MILAENNVVFPNSDSKITINTYKIRLGQKLRMLPIDRESKANHDLSLFVMLLGSSGVGNKLHGFGETIGNDSAGSRLRCK